MKYLLVIAAALLAVSSARAQDDGADQGAQPAPQPLPEEVRQAVATVLRTVEELIDASLDLRREAGALGRDASRQARDQLELQLGVADQEPGELPVPTLPELPEPTLPQVAPDSPAAGLVATLGEALRLAAEERTAWRHEARAWIQTGRKVVRGFEAQRPERGARPNLELPALPGGEQFRARVEQLERRLPSRRPAGDAETPDATK